MSRPHPLSRLVGPGILSVWLPLLAGGLRSLRTRGRFGDSETLIVTGSYASVRHPLYAGLSLTVVGAGLVADSRRLIAGGLAWLLVTRLWSIGEEEVLAKRFAPEYGAYRAATPAIIPRRCSQPVRLQD